MFWAAYNHLYNHDDVDGGRIVETVRQWGLSVCMAAVACGIAQMLLPPGSTEKIFKVSVSAFFLCALFMPIMTTRVDFDISDYGLSETQEDVSEKLKESVSERFSADAQKIIEQKVNSELSKMGITPGDIRIDITTSDDGTVTIDAVELTLSDMYAKDHDRLRAAIQNALGITVRIGYVKDGDADG